MAEIRKIVASSNLSQFRQVAPEAGGAFRVLAAAANTAYDMLEPAAIAKMQAKGDEYGRQLARRQIGETLPYDGGETGGEHPGVSRAASTSFSALQASWGSPLKVNSAYRDPEHNAKVGGAKNSQHTHGNAFDIDVSGLSKEQRVDMIKKARAAGFRGVGVYDNSLHFDVGGDRAWGPSYHRDSLPAWAAEAVASPIGQTAAEPQVTRTVVRTSGGAIEPRLYSPASGPILQAHNAAAGVAYTSEVLNQGLVDLMDMGEQFIGNPDGFLQASRGYVDDLVSQAPEAFRMDVRASLEKEAQRRYLGVLEEKQRDTRQRADNSSRALADRWASNYAEAIATGNPDEIAAARDELQSVLQARESLPGVSWTADQSINFLLDAEDAGRRIIEGRTKEQRNGWKDSLKLIGEAAENGQSAADEALLDDPRVQEAFPQETAMASAKVAFRDAVPGFDAMPLAQQEAVVADLRAAPVETEAQQYITEAAEARVAKNRKAWEEDPIATAEKALPNKPPAMPANLDPNDFATWMGARSEYAKMLMAQGYVDFPAYLTDAEAKNLKAVMGKETPPEVRAAIATAIVSGAGNDAARIFKEIGSDDPVTMMGGQLAARGGDIGVLTQAYTGQMMMAEGLVQAPSNATKIGAISTDIAEAMEAAGVIGAEGDLLKFATAIYASQAQGIDPKDEASTELMAQSVNVALGASQNKRGQATGGVQDIAGNPTLLPPKMSGEALNAALEAAFTTGEQPGGWIAGMDLFGYRKQHNEAMWLDVAGSLPMLGGEPLDTRALSKGQVRIVPVSGNKYRMELTTDGASLQVRNDKGGLFVFDAAKLVEYRPPAANVRAPVNTDTPTDIPEVLNGP